MNTIIPFFIISSPYLLLTVIVTSFIFKSYFIYIMASKGLKTIPVKKPLFFFLGAITGSLVGDWSWVLKLLHQTVVPDYSYQPITFAIRLAWFFLIIQYQSLSLFMQSLTDKSFKPSRLQLFLYSWGVLFGCYFLYRAFFCYSLFAQECDRDVTKNLITPSLEFKIMDYTQLYIFAILIIGTLFYTIRKIQTNRLPKILHKQLNTFIIYLICPYFLTEFMQATFFNRQEMQAYLYPMIALSTLLLTYAIYYCIKKVMKLRFLNFERHVQSPLNPNLIQNFKLVLEQLSNVKSLDELPLIAQSFFKQGFNIPLPTTKLFIRSIEGKPKHDSNNLIEEYIEPFFSRLDKETLSYIQENQVLIYDEIIFNLFYQESKVETNISEFLDTIKVDILIPLYTNKMLLGYLIVVRDARPKECYSEAERNAMLIFASYLANIVNLIQSKNTQALIQQQKELKEELFYKHQEINQYRESITYFLQQTKQKDIGILFYKNRRFNFGNQAAKALIPFDINLQQGHPLSIALKKVVHHVQTFKTPCTQLATINTNDSVSLSGIAHLEQQSVIIIISSPDIAELVSKQMHYLHHQSQWDYLLYLQTTQAGKIIDRLIPGVGEQLVNLKVELLKLSLSKKNIMLDVPDEDQEAFIEVIQHISLRDSLHTLELTHKEKEHEVGSRLFGLNPPININSAQESPLLKKLDGATLFIKNIHCAGKISQARLAEFLILGTFRTIHGEYTQQSDVRLIFSSDRNLFPLVQQNEFNKELFLELKQHRIELPSLLTLDANEFNSLLEGYADQIIQEHPFSNLLALTEKDKLRLCTNRPTSLKELKTKVHQVLLQKSKRNEIDEPTIDPYAVTDPILIEAARLGKQALKDQKIMLLLWSKFKSQSKIATFLGVNRSSVNRRCKEYHFS